MSKPQSTVAIDASRAFDFARTGTENYSYQIIKAIASVCRDYSIVLYVKPHTSIPKEFVELGVDIRTIDMAYLWTQGGLALKTWQDRPDLLFVPAHVLPFIKNPMVQSVVTVHDLRTEFLPQHSDIRQKLYLNQLTEYMRGRLASHIIAVSESTKKDIVERLHVPDDKITVIYEGVDTLRFRRSNASDAIMMKQVKEKLHLPEKYLLFVGTVQPRKNLVRLIEAFAMLIHNNEITDTKLIIAGKRGWLADEIYKAPASFSVNENVNFIDYVEDWDLPYLYAGAQLFVFPSLYEGFGLPVLEALASGVPVVTANNSSLTEVGGRVVTYVNAYDSVSIAEGIKSALHAKFDTIAVQNHIAQFSWDKAGVQTNELFNKLLQ